MERHDETGEAEGDRVGLVSGTSIKQPTPMMQGQAGYTLVHPSASLLDSAVMSPSPRPPLKAVIRSETTTPVVVHGGQIEGNNTVAGPRGILIWAPARGWPPCAKHQLAETP